MSRIFRTNDRQTHITLLKNCLGITFYKLSNDCRRCSLVSEESQLVKTQVSSNESSPCTSLSNSEQESLKCTCDQLNGVELFESFVKENCECFWNQSLVNGISGLKYKGFIPPCTLFMTGSDYTYEVIRTAWARRVIKSPQGYSILNLGDVPTIELFPVFQTQFTPLSEALCKCINDFNNQGVNAFISIIADNIKRQYPNIIPPSLDMLKKSLKTLQKEGKIKYSSKKGYTICWPAQKITSSPNSSLYMTSEEVISQLHGTSNLNAESECSSSAINGESCNLIMTASSSPTNWDLFNSLDDGMNQTLLKRSASLKIPKSNKIEDDANKSFTFTRSKSLRVMSKDKGKSFNENELLIKGDSQKKPSFFSKILMRLGSINKSKETRPNLGVLKPIEDTRKSKSTQTLNRSHSTGAISRKMIKTNSNHGLGKGKCNIISFHKKLLNDCQFNCHYCDAIELGERLHHYNSSKPMEYCPLCPAINFPLSVDPSCETCLASFGFCCNGYNYLNPSFKSHLEKENLTFRHHPSTTLPSLIQPKIPLKLNNKEIDKIEKYKPIAIQSNPLRDDKMINQISSHSFDSRKESNSSFCNSVKKNTISFSPSNNGTLVYPVKFQNEVKQSLGDQCEPNGDDMINSKEIKVLKNEKTSIENLVNVKIEIGSSKSEKIIKNCSSHETKNDSCLNKCNYNGYESFSDPNVVNSFKDSSLTTATTVTTSLINNVSSVDICTISKSEDKTSLDTSIKPLKSSLGIKIEDYKSSKINDLNQNNKMAFDSSSNYDQAVLPSMSNIRQKVAKAKAAFFNESSLVSIRK